MSNVNELLMPLLLLMVVVAGSAVQANQIQANCVTPDNALGMCLDVKYCVSIMTALINNDHLTNSDVARFLRESQCGLSAGSQKVCCNINSIDFGGEPLDNDNNAARNGEDGEMETENSIDNENCGELAENETPLKWIAELWFRNVNVFQLRCLGTLISAKHVMVPAHCVALLPANVSVSHIVLQNHEYKVTKIFIHASYNQPKFANDIALIELDPDDDNRRSSDDGRSDNASINNAICLEMSTTNAFKSTLVLTKSETSALKYGKIEFISDNQCSSFFDQQQFTDLMAGQFCANILAAESDASTIHSRFIGAAVLQSNNRRRYSLKGFTSTSIRTEQAFDESRPYIFTDVQHHLGWIRAAIGSIVPLSSSSSPSLSSPTTTVKDCQLSENTVGKCVSQEQCTLYRDAPRPLSRQQEAYLEQIKCTYDEDYVDDGICCPLKYINLTESSSSSSITNEIDETLRFKRGAKLLDLQKCGRQTTATRIVGGKRAGLREFPWFGLVKYRIGSVDKFTCGSSLISSRYVLTCAHCITNLPHGYRVVAIRLGEYDIRTNPDCDPENFNDCNPPFLDISVEDLIPHEKYNNPRYSNDIGLVRLEYDVDFSANGITPICLPINAEMRGPFNSKYMVTGFGLTEHGRESDVLLKIFVPKVERETCQSFHRSVIQLSEGHECYGGEGIVDSCKGDSGGPAMNVAAGSDGVVKVVQLGIVAAGHSDCGQGASGYPGIYTDVKYFIEWILDNMSE